MDVQMCQANGCTAEATTVAKWDLGDVMGTKSTIMVRHYCDDHAAKVVGLAAGMLVDAQPTPATRDE